MKLKVQTDDGTITVDPSKVEVEGGQLIKEGESPEGYVSRDFMQSEIQRRLSGKVSMDDAIDSFKSDDDLFREACEARGIELNDDLKPVGTDDVDVESLKQRWTRENVDPLKEELTTKEELLQTLKGSGLSSTLESAAAQHGVKKAFRPHVKEMFKGQFEFDPETRTWAKRSEDGDGFEYSTKASDGNRYVTPNEFFQSLKSDPQYEELFENEGPGNTGLGDTKGGSNRTWTEAEIEQMSDKEYEANREEIHRAMEEGRIQTS